MAYRRIDTKMWDDEKFIGFGLQTKLFWCYILTGPQTTALPGLYVSGIGTLMDGFRGEVEDVSAALAELTANNLVEVDRTLRVIRIPNAPAFNAPSTPNQIVGWWKLFLSIPDSPLKWAHVAALMECVGVDAKPSMKLAWNQTFGTLPTDRLPAGFVNRFINAGVDGGNEGASKQPSKGASKGRQSRIQDQVQDQDQGQDQNAGSRNGGPKQAPPPARPPAAPPPPPPAPPPAPAKNGDTSLPWKGAPVAHDEQQAILQGLWSRYRDTFDPEGKQPNGKAYHFQIHGDALSRSLRSEPLCDYDDPVLALQIAYEGFATNKLRMGEGKLGNRLFAQLLRPDQLVGAIDRGTAQRRGVNPDVMPAPERAMPPPPPAEPKEGYYEPPEQADTAPESPADRRAHLKSLIEKAKSRPGEDTTK